MFESFLPTDTEEGNHARYTDDNIDNRGDDVVSPNLPAVVIAATGSKPNRPIKPRLMAPMAANRTPKPGRSMVAPSQVDEPALAH